MAEYGRDLIFRRIRAEEDRKGEEEAERIGNIAREKSVITVGYGRAAWKDEPDGGRKTREKEVGEQGETKRGLGAPSPGHRASAFRIPKPIRSVRDPKDTSSIRVPSAFAIERAASFRRFVVQRSYLAVSRCPSRR
ncbi:hypothetical protein WN48_01192 [Eufriesea mexicana]|nr:hypothetical protein WN48_01192 [Eufriesea mexicana]